MLELGIFQILLVFAVTVNSQDDLLITTKSGPVRGIKVTNPAGNVVDTFYGIPFAEPPVGDLRFRRPQPVKPWSDVFNANTKPNACYQIPLIVFGNFTASKKFEVNTPMEEDCLYLNIWVPNPHPAKSAVMVWIYGGGFFSGSSALEIYDGSILASKENIIVASMNYRLLSLGFLYLGTEMAPGNMGLLDQVMALEWLHNNIESFGGDPNKITIFGESAGAAGVSYHLLSPLSRNLFSRAIMQSGSSTAKWAWASPEKLKEYSVQFADKVGCSDKEDHFDAMVTCLNQKDPYTLITAAPDIINEFMDFGFSPVTDNYFITKPPLQYILESDFKECPILVGSTHEEGTMAMIFMLPEYFSNTECVTFSKARFLELLPQLGKEFVSTTGETIANNYIHWSGNFAEENYIDLVDKIIGDRFIHCPLNQYADAYSQKETVYMYHFVHRITHNPWPQWVGVPHAEEIPFVFGEPFNPGMEYTDEERTLSQRVMRYWVNFAKSGNPNSDVRLEDEVEWPKFNENKNYLIIKPTPTSGTGLRAEQCHFWDHEFPELLNLI